MALLGAVVPGRGVELEAALDKLIAAGIVFPEGSGAHGNFSFKHGLARDAAYINRLSG